MTAHPRTRLPFHKLTAASAAAMLLALSAVGPAKADAVEDFYKGKTITFIVGSGPGGSYDLYARLLAASMSKYIPGHPTVVVKLAGGVGGGLPVAVNVQAAVPKDGTVIAMTQQTIVVSQVTEPLAKGKYDVTTWNWIGLMAPVRNMLAIWHTAKAQTLDEAKTTEVIIGSTGRVSPTYIVPNLLNQIYGTKFKIVTGYNGVADLNLAMERGEIEGRGASWISVVTQAPQYITEKKLKPVAVDGLTKEPGLENVPLLVELAKDDKQRGAITLLSSAAEFGRAVFAPPGVPADRVEALRRAFDATMKDPELLADAEKRGIPVEPHTGEELQKIAAKVIASSPEAVEYAVQLMSDANEK
jgi:tripartite-type tricarboxylate transporter receptor subunit TctC